MPQLAPLIAAALILASSPAPALLATPPAYLAVPPAAPASSPPAAAAPGQAVAPGAVAASPPPQGGATPAAGPLHPLRASATAFGTRLEIEIRDLQQQAANAAIAAAVAEVAEVERLTDPLRSGSEVAALNAAAGKGPRPVEPRLFAALARALDFCLWSDGKMGPLGRDLHRLWGLGGDGPLAAAPGGEPLRQAVAACACRRLTLDGRKQTAALDAGSALDLADFAAGMAVDRAVEVLRQHGSANAFVHIGALHRGIGGGRDGRGWAIDLPAMGGLVEPLGRIYLRNQALAVATRDDHPIHLGGQLLPPFVNQRTGQPTEGVAATLAASDLALDAQALAATLSITGAQEGELLMGSIRPRPSILWLMGSGTGIPLLVDYRWTEIARR
jgi:thiamine biosynthesis lipoprotein